MNLINLRTVQLGSLIALLCTQLLIGQELTKAPSSSDQNDFGSILQLEGDKANLPEGATKVPKVVLISGDDEYRSEEGLPMLAQILSTQHGIQCVVSFSINPDCNCVDPNYHFNNSGLEHLADADAMILFTRFREWPDEQMKLFEDYVKQGKPIIALRTATHPFAHSPDSESSFKDWVWNSKSWPGGFGQNVIGETWHSHHGKHKSESARAIIEPGQENHPILRGVKDVWAPSDVYGVVRLPKDATILMRGQVLEGMEPTDPPVSDGRNEPMMPMVWTKSYQYKDGKEGKVFCSTMCSSVDLKNEGLRRLIINATYWSLGWESLIPENNSVDLPGDYQPTFFGFKMEPGYFTNQNRKPVDFLVK